MVKYKSNVPQLMLTEARSCTAPGKHYGILFRLLTLKYEYFIKFEIFMTKDEFEILPGL